VRLGYRLVCAGRSAGRVILRGRVMFRKGRHSSGRPDQKSTPPPEVLGGPAREHETSREAPMLDRERSVSPPTDGGGTFLGTDVEFKGSLKFGDRLRIDGRFDGELTSSGTLHVGPQGDVRADIDVGGAVVEGTVEGNITASDRVELRSTARMTGDVRASKLVVEEGVVFLGRCEVGPGKVSASSSTKKSKAEPESELELQQSEIEIGLGT